MGTNSSTNSRGSTIRLRKLRTGQVPGWGVACTGAGAGCRAARRPGGAL